MQVAEEEKSLIGTETSFCFLGLPVRSGARGPNMRCMLIEVTSRGGLAQILIQSYNYTAVEQYTIVQTQSQHQAPKALATDRQLIKTRRARLYDKPSV